MMLWQKIIGAVVGIGVLGVGAYFLFSPKTAPFPEDVTPEKLVVAASIVPLADIVRQVGGDNVEVITILSAGVSEHTYEPTPEAVRSVQNAKLFLKIGYGLDDWTDKIAQSVSESLPVKNVAAGITLRKSAEEFEEDEEKGVGFPEDEGLDPHYFLQLENGARIAKTVADFLSETDRAKAALYQMNADRYAKELRDEGARLQQQFSALLNKKIVTFHDAWFYFADHYGLEVVGTFEPFPGKEPTPQYLADFIKQVREDEIKVLFTEPQFSSVAISQVASDLGIRLETLDPIGGTTPQTQTYLDLIRTNAATILTALGN